jgi:hypothetical protein
MTPERMTVHDESFLESAGGPGDRREPIVIKRVLRKMRGGSQPYLIEGEDGQFYVAKFRGNPQGTRTLVNEWITSHLIKQIGILSPPISFLRLPQQLTDSSDLHFCFGHRCVPIQSGVHLGSLCPVNPERIAIYDVLPPSLFGYIENISDFAFAFVFDRWVGQQDTRQAVFVSASVDSPELRFLAFMIDHGFSFGGDAWAFLNTSRAVCSSSMLRPPGLYFDRRVYRLLEMRPLCHEAINRIRQIPRDEVLNLLTPELLEWLDIHGSNKIENMLVTLDQRKNILPSIVTRDLDELEL